MRIKTVPRHIQNCARVGPTSESIVSSCEQPEDSSTSDEEKKAVLKHTTEALDLSGKCKTYPSRKKLLNRCAIVACLNRKYSELPAGAGARIFVNDNNNDANSTNMNLINFSMAGSSSSTCTEMPCDTTIRASVKDENNTEIVNLSKKHSHAIVEENSSSTSVESEDKFKDTFLYKIMTDPTFLENIQRNKQPKKYICQFCKQEFVNGDELANHMIVKKDESNQIVCCACKKTFTQKRYLRYHQRCHSERTKFTCDICTKKYTRLDNLTRHNAFHVNPDKFSCTSCEKTFARKDLLNKHQKCHDNKYRFFCETCQKYFKGPLTLDNHKKIFHSVL